MRLISCHIENFGKLSDETVSFDSTSGLNIICRDNGWGKSTFATFIKVMFFGFDNDGKRSETENERRHFKPWQGGVYGGQVTFEADGKSYIMSRTFGAKEKDDEFILQDAGTNLESADFSKNIGEELFQIDRASFLRSVYISQNDCKTVATDSINAKLGNLAESTDDLNNFETANKKISDKLNSLSRRRKTGVLYKQKEQIAELKQQIKNGHAIDVSMDEILSLKKDLNDSYVGLKDEREILQERQKTISEYRDLEVKKSEYRHLCEDFERKQIIFEKRAAFFPERIPTSDEVDKYIHVLRDNSVLKKELDIYDMEEGELSELDLLKGRFATGIPDSETIGEKYRDVQDMQELLQRIEKSMLTADEQEQLWHLSEKFSDGVLTQENIDYMSKAWLLRTEKKNTLNSKKAAADMLARAGAGNAVEEKGCVEKEKGNAITKKSMRNSMPADESDNVTGADGKRGAIGIILLLLVIAACVIAVYFLTGSLLACALCAAALFLVASVSKKLLKNSRKTYTPESNIFMENTKKQDLSDTNLPGYETDKENPYFDLMGEISQDEEIIARTEKEMGVFLGRYNVLFDENNVVADLYQMREDVKLFKNLSEKACNGDMGELQAQYGQMKKDMMGFLHDYGFVENGRGGTDNINDIGTVDASYAERNFVMADETNRLAYYRNLLHSLEKSANNYIMLKEKKQKYDSALVLHEKNTELLEAFLSGLGMRIDDDVYSQLQELKDALRDYLASKEECDRSEEIKKAFEENHDDIEIIKNAEIKEDGMSLAETEERLSEISLEIEKYHTLVNDYNHRLEQMQEQKDDIMDFERQLEELQELFAQNEKKEKTLQKTQQYLRQAKTSLIAKYTKPVKDSFDRYYNILSGIDADKYQLDADFKMSFVEQGMPRDIGFLSTGYQDMVGICMRMALVDAMYGGEKPFVVFDDPFVNFDGKKTACSLKMLGEIAREYQIVYFTCKEGKCD